MRPKSLILLALALGCGLVASIGISQVLEARRHRATGDEQTEILVALADIERNTEFNDKNVALKPWPKAQVPVGAITQLDKAMGRRPSTRIFKEEPILEGKLGTGEGSAPASVDIPPGYGTIPVRMDNSQNSGLILPGDRVDVQVFVNKGPNVPEATTTTFLHDVSVFAVNSEIRKDPNSEAKIDAKTVSLLVTPEQAAKLTLAAEVGTIRLFLRGTKSEPTNGPIKITLGDVVGSSDSGANTTASLGGGSAIADFLKKQGPGKPVEPAPDKRVFKMVVQHGQESHIEELSDGEPLPRKVTPDGQPVNADGESPEPPATTSHSNDDAPVKEPMPATRRDTTPVSSPMTPGGSALHRPAPTR